MTRTLIPPAQLASLVREICELEIRAFKPGNVSLESAGHGMQAAHFLQSAEAIAAPISRVGASVGERILDSVVATQAVAGCNTNLGIVLLLAPLVHATLAQTPQLGLRARTRQVLVALDVEDARKAYAAIRLAAPGGLGSSDRHDVGEPPTVTLLAAMDAASGHDRIACQYATGFGDVFDFGLPLAGRALQRYASAEWAAVAVYLAWLSRFPDTHIVRKHGAALAESVRKEAVVIESAFDTASCPEDVLPLLRSFDASLKLRAINPGTSADLTVASLAAWHLQEVLDHTIDGRSASLAEQPLSPAGHDPRVF